MSHVIQRRGAISTVKGVESFGPWYIATKHKGVDNTGATDSTKGLIEAAQTAVEKRKGLFIPGGKYLINSGTGFNLKEVNFEKCEYGEGFIGWEMFCSPASQLIAGAALGNHPILTLAPEIKKKIAASFFKIGQIEGHLKEQVCIKLQNVTQSEIHIGRVNEGSVGVYLDGVETGLRNPSVADDIFFITAIGNCTTGLLSESLQTTVEEKLLTFQNTANTFFLPEVAVCGTGVQMDTETLANKNEAESQFNEFFVTVEQNTVQGILDFAPSNKWNIKYSNLNGPEKEGFPFKEGPGYVVGKGMKSPGPAYVHGHILDGCEITNLPERGCDIVNTAVEAGKAVIHKNEQSKGGGAFVAFEPAVPATETNVASPYERPAFVYLAPNTGIAAGELGTLVEVNGVQYPLNLARLPESEQVTLPRGTEKQKVYAENNNSALQLREARKKGWTTGREAKYIGPGTAGGAFEVGKTYKLEAAATGANVIGLGTAGAIKPKATEIVEVELLPDKPKTTEKSTKLKLAKSKVSGYNTNPGAGVQAGARAVKILAGTGGFVEPEGKVTNESNKMTEVSSLTGIAVGNFIVGAGVPSGTTVLSSSGTEVVMSQNATATEAKQKYKFQALLVGTVFFIQSEVGTEEFALAKGEAGAAIEMKATEELEVELVSVPMHPRLAQFYRLLPGQVIKLKYENALAPAWRWELST